MTSTSHDLPFLRELAQRLDTDPSADVSARQIGTTLDVDDDTQLHQVLARLRRRNLVEFSGTPRRLGDNNLTRPLTITAAGEHAAITRSLP